MPSVSNKPENRASTEVQDPIKQVITVVEKKLRNLEKRKGKLEEYKSKADGGEILNKDQEQAILKYDSVITNLEFARELQKQFVGIGTDLEKLQRKAAKREKVEKHAAEMKKVQEILKLQSLLDNMGPDCVREDFKSGRNGACQLSDKNLEQLDNLYKLVSPTRDGETSYEEQLSSASDHLVRYIEGQEKEVVGSTYKDLRTLTDRIQASQYFENLDANKSLEATGEEKKDEGTEKTEEEENLVEEEVPSEDQSQSIHHQSEIHEVVQTSVIETQESVQQQQVSQQEVLNVGGVSAETDPAVVAAAQDLVGMVGQPNYPETDDSFFTTTSYGRNRPFTDIVSSVQGTFNFLQDSHIDSQTPHIDPAVVAAQPMGTINQSAGSLQTPGQTDFLSASATANQTVDSLSQSQNEATQQNQIDYSTVIPGLDFGQNQMVPGLQNSYSDQSQTAASSLANQMVALSTEQSVLNTPDVPPSIPLPNPATLSEQQGLHDEKKHYAMNPNAVSFQSMYTAPPGGSSSTTTTPSGGDYQQQEVSGSSSSSGGVSQQQQTQQQQHQSDSNSKYSSDNKYNDKYNDKYNSSSDKYQDYHNSSSSYNNSSYGQSQGGYGGYRNSGPRGGRGGSGGPRDNQRDNRNGRGGPGGMSNGYNSQRGPGGPPGSKSGNPNSRGGYNNRGGSRGMRGGPRGGMRGSNRGSYGGGGQRNSGGPQ